MSTELGPKSKNDLAREQLVVLHEGERPTAVTVAAVVALLIALSNVISFLAGVEIDGHKPMLSQVVLPTVVMLAAAVGMWYARYWAVLGFQTLLAVLILIMSLALLRAENVLSALLALAIIASAGTLFWFLVKALARIQMPKRLPRDR